MSGCSTQPKAALSEPQYDTAIPQIPRLQWLGDINAIALEWEPNHDPEIAGYHIYRKLKDAVEAPFKRIAIIQSRFQSHYIDLHLPTQTKYLYQIAAVNYLGFESKPSQTTSAITRPTFQSVSYFTSLNKLPRKAKLIWRPHKNGRVSSYVVERKTPGDSEWEKHAVLEHRLIAEYIDHNLDDDQIYLYRLRAQTFDGIYSTPSDIVKIITKSLPKSITALDITTKLPHSIKLRWKPLRQEDISHYNVYRSTSIDGGYSVVARVQKPSFENNLTSYGNSFFYKVSAEDFDGLESLHTQAWLGKNLPLPKPIILRGVNQRDERITLRWERGDNRTIKYKIIKSEKLGWFKNKDTVIMSTKASFETTQKPNVPVNYTIYAIDEHDIESLAVTTDNLTYKVEIP